MTSLDDGVQTVRWNKPLPPQVAIHHGVLTEEYETLPKREIGTRSEGITVTDLIMCHSGQIVELWAGNAIVYSELNKLYRKNVEDKAENSANRGRWGADEAWHRAKVEAQLQ